MSACTRFSAAAQAPTWSARAETAEGLAHIAIALAVQRLVLGKLVKRIKARRSAQQRRAARAPRYRHLDSQPASPVKVLSSLCCSSYDRIFVVAAQDGCGAELWLARRGEPTELLRCRKSCLHQCWPSCSPRNAGSSLKRHCDQPPLFLSTPASSAM